MKNKIPPLVSPTACNLLRRPLLIAAGLIFGVSQLIAAPANDDFANAQILTGTLLQVDGTTVAATKEIGDPATYPLSVWYSWTAPRRGFLDLATQSLGASRRLEVFQLNGVRTIFNLYQLDVDYYAISRLGVSSGVEYLICVSDSNYNSSGNPFTLLLSFTPTYSSAVAITTGGLYLRGVKRTISGRVSTPADVTGVRVRTSGAGYATNVRYFRKSGTFQFTHVRRGAAPKRGFYRPVTYVVQALHGSAVIGQAAKTFRVIR